MKIFLIITSIIGCITIVFFIFSLISTIVKVIKAKKEFKTYRTDLVKSGFIQDLYKKIDDEEKEDLNKTGKGGKTVTFNTKTHKKTVENKNENK